MKEKTNIKFWEKVSFVYGKFMRNNEEVYGETCEVIAKYLKKDMEVLEIACGTGQFTSLLCKHSDKWIGTDFSANMVENAKENIIENNVDFRVEDATKLSFEDETFDAILIANALHIMPEPKKALREIKRTLKQAGILFAPTFIYDENVPKLRMWILEKIGFKTYNKFTSEELEKMICECGFEVMAANKIKARPLSECLVIARVCKND